MFCKLKSYLLSRLTYFPRVTLGIRGIFVSWCLLLLCSLSTQPLSFSRGNTMPYAGQVFIGIVHNLSAVTWLFFLRATANVCALFLCPVQPLSGQAILLWNQTISHADTWAKRCHCNSSKFVDQWWQLILSQGATFIVGGICEKLQMRYKKPVCDCNRMTT